MVYFVPRIGYYYICSSPGSKKWTTVDIDDDIRDIVVIHQDNDYRLCYLPSSGVLHADQPVRVPQPVCRLSLMYRRSLVVLNKNDDDVLFVVERKVQWAWEVWRINNLKHGMNLVHSIKGVVMFLSGSYSAAYLHRPEFATLGLDIDNCICFTEDGDDDNIYVFRLRDQSVSMCKNQPNPGFPVWFPQRTNYSGIPWLSFNKDDPKKSEKQNAAVAAEANDNLNDSDQPVLDESCDELVGNNICCILSKDLQWLIATSLDSAVDYGNLRSVCRNWREIARPIWWKPTLNSTSESVKFPWLMSCRLKGASSSFIDPTTSMIYPKHKNPQLDGCSIRYSKDGWLLVTRDKSCWIFFYEPFSDTKISLPNLPNPMHIDAIAFSSSPTSSDWVIVAIFSISDGVCVRYLKSGDKKWNFLVTENDDDFVSCGCSPVLHNNKFYFLGEDGTLATFWLDISGPMMSFSSPTESSIEQLSSHCRGFLFSIEDSLYLVVARVLGQSVAVYNLDLATSKWCEVKTLEKFSLFNSETSSFAVRVTKTIHQNSINFPLFASGDRYLFYKLDDGKFKFYNGDDVSTEDFYKRKEYFYCTWLQPKVARAYR